MLEKCLPVPSCSFLSELRTESCAQRAPVPRTEKTLLELRLREKSPMFFGPSPLTLRAWRAVRCGDREKFPLLCFALCEGSPFSFLSSAAAVMHGTVPAEKIVPLTRAFTLGERDPSLPRRRRCLQCPRPRPAHHLLRRARRQRRTAAPYRRHAGKAQ